MSASKYSQIAIEALVMYENNARTHSPEQVDKIARSIQEFGFINPVLINKDNVIIAGHGRVMAAKQIGMEKVPCLRVEHLTDDQMRAYVIADNKLAEDAGWDFDILKIELQSLRDLDFDISLTGFEFDDFNFETKRTDLDDSEEEMFDDVDKLEKHYGVPYQGNKSRIADIIVSVLPEGKRLVDLFGGGGAITHCALLSNKWERQLYNDINPMITTLFVDAINGKYHNENRVVTREDFELLKDTDPYVKYIWSFGNSGGAYLWGKNIEKEKCLACEMIFESDVQERRKKYSKLIKLLRESTDPTPERLAVIERLQAITQLEALQLHKLEVTNISYQDYKYQNGDVVYCDVPYEDITKNKCNDYGLEFDSKKFYEWVKKQKFPVYFSSYEISDDSFFKIKLKSVMSLIGSNTNGQFRNEYLYSNREIVLND